MKRQIQQVDLKLQGKAYPILIGRGIISDALTKLKSTGVKKAFILADAALPSQARQLVSALKKAGWQTQLYSVKASEAFKSFQRIYPYYGRLLEDGADRNSVLFALGGGVIGDAAGFLAGTYLRGIRWVGVPTTLLAQVDSSIGGKTAVNHTFGKNLIGAFHQPSMVICDTGFLKTLPTRERVSGLGEMIKYGLIYDARFYDDLVSHWKKLLSLHEPSLGDSIAKCARYKSRAVQKDEYDLKGVREKLNFGHTVAHALEGATRYGYFRHGEAVILGMRAAVALSVLKGHLKAKQQIEIEDFLSELPVPELPSGMDAARLMSYIKFDKKKSAEGRVRFVLLKGIGKTVSDSTVTDSEVLGVLDWIFFR